MECCDGAGKFIMVDDPRFEPIFSHLEQTDRTLLMHIGEGKDAWLPLEGNRLRVPPEEFPQYHLYPRRHELPSHEALVASRDRVVERHPNLRIVGAHLGSLDYDVAEIARRLDRYPNFAVDTSARLYSLSLQARETVRQFIVDHSDRILFGTDVDLERPQSTLSPEEQERDLRSALEMFEPAFGYFGSNDVVKVRYHRVQGLDLPAKVLQNLFADNALRWYPDLGGGSAA